MKTYELPGHWISIKGGPPLYCVPGDYPGVVCFRKEMVVPTPRGYDPRTDSRPEESECIVYYHDGVVRRQGTDIASLEDIQLVEDPNAV